MAEYKIGQFEKSNDGSFMKQIWDIKKHTYVYLRNEEFINPDIEKADWTPLTTIIRIN